MRSRWRAVAASHLGGLPKTFWIVFAGQLVNRVGSMIVPFLVYYLTTRGLTPGQAGAVLAAVGLGGLVSQPLGGLLADHIGIRFTLVAGLLSSAVSIALLGLVTSLPAIVVTAVVCGATADIYRPAAAALVAIAVRPAHRPRAYSLIYWAVNLGVGISGLLGGILAQQGYWLLFALESSTTAAFAVLVALAVPRVAASPPANELADGKRSKTSSGLLRDRLFLVLVGLNLANGLITAQITFGLPLAIQQDGLSTSLYGAVFLVCGLLIGFSQPPLTAWLRRFDRMTVLSASWAVFGIGMGLNGLASERWHYLAITVVWTAGEIGAASFVGSLIADLAPIGAQGRYQAAFGWSFASAQLIGPLLGVALYDHLGSAALWWSCVVLGVAAGAIGLALVPSTQLRTTIQHPSRPMEYTK